MPAAENERRLTSGRVARVLAFARAAVAIWATVEVVAAWGPRWLTVGVVAGVLSMPVAAGLLRGTDRPSWIRQTVSVLGWIDAGISLALVASFPPMSGVPGVPTGTMVVLAVASFAVAVLRGGFASEFLSSVETWAFRDPRQ